MRHLLRIAIAVLSLAISQAQAGSLSVTSPRHTVPVIDLYTSQGCSSCPPAEAWLRKLQRNGYDKRVNILAFHVDYWNHLGWKDPFSSRLWTTRQRLEAARLSLHTIYTPQLIVHGMDFRSWKSLARAIQLINGIKPAATLKLSVSAPSRTRLDISILTTLNSPVDAGKTRTWIAVVENNLVRRIRAGENTGRTLISDNVVRAMFPVSHNGRYSIRLKNEWQRKNLKLVAFVRHRQSGQTLQSVSLPLGKLDMTASR
jgi:hypothetical protein